jgi:hypothetical protein
MAAGIISPGRDSFSPVAFGAENSERSTIKRTLADLR